MSKGTLNLPSLSSEGGRLRRLLPMLLLLVGCSGPAEEPAHLVGVSEPLHPGPCPTLPCSIGISEPLVVLGGDDDPTGRLDPFSPVQLDDHWGLFTPAMHQEGTVLFWDWNGSVVRQVGSYGEGPGEAKGVVSVLSDSEGRLHMSGSEGSWSIFDRSGSYLRRIYGRFSPGTLNILVDDSLVVSGWAGRTRFLLTHLDDGRQVGLGPTGPGGLAPGLSHLAESTEPGTFWAIDYQGHSIERWTVSGEQVDSITPVDALFPVFTEPGVPEDEDAPQIAIGGLHVGSELIWVVGGIRERASEEAALTRFVQALDRSSGRAVASAVRIGEEASTPMIHGFVNDTLAWAIAHDSLGVAELELRRYGLISR